MNPEVHYQNRNIAGEEAPASSTTKVAVGQDNTTKELTRIWQELLGIEPISVDQNYFDLGGDSILAVQLFAQIEKLFQIKLPVATLFEAPTIERLSQLLRRDVPVSGWSPLVAIQPAGARPVFFCFHGAGGNVLIYRELSRNLGADQPFYGLQSKGLDGSCAPLTTVEEMAALYLKEIRMLRPHGPYFLGGYCGGGTIAFEAAQQLQSQGESIALLALFDTSNWSKIRPPSAWDNTYYTWQQFLFHGGNFFKLNSESKMKFFRAKAEVLRTRIPVWRGMLLARFDNGSPSGISDARVLSEIWRANDRACWNYVPKPYPGPITDFRSITQYRLFNKPGAKWDLLAQAGQDIVVLPVYPGGMLVEPFVKHLAVALRDSMDEAIRRYRAT
jgi:phthiocerol/phenolphthiocerol synthesis type-I polyketide synthase E